MGNKGYLVSLVVAIFAYIILWRMHKKSYKAKLKRIRDRLAEISARSDSKHKGKNAGSGESRGSQQSDDT